MNEKVMFIRHDGNRPGMIEGKDKRPFDMFDTPEGFRVYVTDDIEQVGSLCARSGEKYRLFRSKAFKVKVRTPNSSYVFEDLVSWNYRKVVIDTRRVGDDGQRIYDTKIEWYPHGPEEICAPTEEAITGKRPVELPEVYTALAERNREVAALTKTIEDLRSQVRTLEQRVKDLDEMNRMLSQTVAATAQGSGVSASEAAVASEPQVDAPASTFEDDPLEAVAFGGIGALPDVAPAVAPVAPAPVIPKRRGRPSPRG